MEALDKVALFEKVAKVTTLCNNVYKSINKSKSDIMAYKLCCKKSNRIHATPAEILERARI